MSKSRQNEITDLIHEYFQRELSALELEVLSQALKKDSDLQKYFTEQSRDEVLLHRTLEKKKQIQFPLKKTYLRRFKRIAAVITILLSLGTIYLVQRASLPTAGIFSLPVARVTELFALESDAITAVNAGYVRKLIESSELRSGDIITVPKGARLSFQYKDEDTAIELDSDTTFEIISARNGAKHFHLHDGKLMAQVARQPEGLPLKVLTDQAEVVVLGTRFELSARFRTRLSVFSGQVQMNSLADGKQVVVDAGYLAEAASHFFAKPQPIRYMALVPFADNTLNLTPGIREYIAVDPVRNYRGMLQFDLGDLEGRVIEAYLVLHVMQFRRDYGGDGMVRVHKVNTGPDSIYSSKSDFSTVELAHYNGKVGAGMELGIQLDPEQLEPGINTLMLTLDEGGNDFWFSSRDGAFAPILNLRVIPEKREGNQ